MSGTPPTISPRDDSVAPVDAGLTLLGEPLTLASLGDAATVAASVIAAAGLAVTGYQMVLARKREDRRELGRAIRVGLSASWPQEVQLEWRDGKEGSVAMRYNISLDIVNGNDTSITQVKVEWRTMPRHQGVLADADVVGPIEVILPNSHVTGRRLSVRTNVESMPPPINTYTEPWSNTLEVHPGGGLHTPGQKKHEAAIAALRAMGSIVLTFELDGILWQRDAQGVTRVRDVH